MAEPTIEACGEDPLACDVICPNCTWMGHFTSYLDAQQAVLDHRCPPTI